MPSPAIEIRGLDELIQRMRQYPKQLHAAIQKTMDAAMLTLWENVPPYPPEPENSTYDRTGTLGRTLGSSEGGGKTGQPDIYEVKKLGSAIEGRFGTNLDYAPYVIGDETQAKVHQGRWWTMSKIKDKAQEKIERLFETMADKLAAWLEKK